MEFFCKDAYFCHLYDFIMGLIGHPLCVPNMNSLASAIVEMLKGAQKYWGAPLAQGHTHFFLWV